MSDSNTPDCETVQKEMLAALGRIEAHTVTLETSLKASIKANGEYAAEIVTLKSERDAAQAQVKVLADLLNDMVEDSGGLANECNGSFRDGFEALRVRAREALKENGQ